MSEHQHVKGTLRSTGKTIREVAIYHGYEDDVSNDYMAEEQYVDEGKLENAVVIGGIIWEIINQKDIDPYDDVYNATANEDGTIDFEVRFYNGGCCLDEAIHDAINNLKRTKA